MACPRVADSSLPCEATEAMTKNWTDERLEERFDRIDDRFDAIDRQFEAVDRKFAAVDQRFVSLERRMDEGFNSLQSTMNRFGGAMIIGLFGLIATQL